MPPAQCGVCIISVDLGNSETSQALAEGRLSAAADEALARLNRAGWGATWSLGRAIDREWIDAVVRQPGHELAILADADWHSVENRRGRFSQELCARLERADEAGFRPTTLALSSGHLPEHLDLLVKHGISAVRTTRVDDGQPWRGWRRWFGSARARCDQLQSLRWGLWEFDGALSLARQGLRRISQALSAAAAEGGLAHVVVSLDQLAGQGASGLKQLDRLLAQASSLRDRQAIQAQTVSSFVARLSRTRQGAAARSILRPAA
jgi:hypothetical protein